MRHDQDAAVAAVTVAEDARSALLADLLGRVAGCFPRRETRQCCGLGTVGGIALCQVAVTLTYTTGRGHALIGRALYLPEACAADEEHRELAGVPEEVMFASKPQPAGSLLDRAHSRRIRAAFVAGDEVYGGRQLRRDIRQRGMGYVMAFRANHVVTTGSLSDIPHPHAAENDVIVRVYAAGFTPGELDWPGTWTDRAGRDRTPSVPGHELSGVVSELGYGTTGLTVGQRVFGLADWTRDGALAEYTAVEARNLAPLPADIDYAVAAAVPISGLTAWQGLFDHAGLKTGQTVLIHGAAGGVGSMAVQLAHELGSRVIGTGRAADREAALGLERGRIRRPAGRPARGGRRGRRGVRCHRGRGPRTLGPAGSRRRNAGHDHRPAAGAARRRPGDLLCRRAGPAPAADLAERVRSGRLQPIIGAVRPLAEAPSAFTPDRRMPGKTIIRVTEGE